MLMQIFDKPLSSKVNVLTAEDYAKKYIGRKNHFHKSTVTLILSCPF